MDLLPDPIYLDDIGLLLGALHHLGKSAAKRGTDARTPAPRDGDSTPPPAPRNGSDPFRTRRCPSGPARPARFSPAEGTPQPGEQLRHGVPLVPGDDGDRYREEQR